MARSTSYRISEDARHKLAGRAAVEGISATALLDRLITEGVDASDHPGIVFRGLAHDRRAGLAAGPDVWEVVSRLQELEGAVEERVAMLAEETDLHPREIRAAVDYASEHADEVQARIDGNHAAAERSERAARHRDALIA